MTAFLFRLIGILQIAGGFFGLASMLHHLLPLGGGLGVVFDLIGVALYAFILIAGVLLVEGHARGQTLSLWAQGLQIPLLATPVLSYALHSGAFANVFMTLQQSPHLGFDWHVGTYGWVLSLGGPAAARLGVNLLALVSWVLLKLR
jgi:hypothetical protein